MMSVFAVALQRKKNPATKEGFPCLMFLCVHMCELRFRVVCSACDISIKQVDPELGSRYARSKCLYFQVDIDAFRDDSLLW